jgi:hypothetical protein
MTDSGEPALAYDGLPPRLQAYIASFADNETRPQMGHYPGLPAVAWPEPGRLPIVTDLEENYAAIRDEIMRVPEFDFHPERERIPRSGSWDVLMFYDRGYKHIANCDRCPVTVRVVKRNDTVRSLGGLIYASRMRPRTHIAAHRGPTNVRLRCHLALAVASGDCAIRVGDEVRQWMPGRCLVFDDSFEHEAWNRTPQDRIVLVVDVWHPDLTAQERAVLCGLHRYATAHASSLGRYFAAAGELRTGIYH